MHSCDANAPPRAQLECIPDRNAVFHPPTSATVKTVKTVGAAYIAFEALEYAGILEEARRSNKNRQLMAQTRDYVLRTVDGIRHDIRTQLNPKKVQGRFRRAMEKDKPGTVGVLTGAFLGFAL